ncbi:MAG: ketose-bisphosphate aldolase [Sporolactobacillus sp.]|jgi:fructose-bisphosphate aldolase class II|nr:ketose-bisphosphate aldolase [Sporolactobacillus sp.]
MLVSGNRLLQVAHRNHFAIPAFNAGSGQLFTATLEKCEQLQAPFIMAIHPTELAFLRDSFVGQVIRAANHTDLPIALHLDHGASFEQVVHCIHIGFTSVMIDASLKSFAENVALTKKVVEAAHSAGVSVEAELGTIGDTGNNIKGHLTTVKYADPKVAKKFVEETHVDSLAIAIGTAHGLYPKDVKPNIKPEIVKAVAALIDIPLVLHGASNNPDDKIKQSIANGINKINISSDIKIAFAKELRKVLNDNDPDEIREPKIMFPSPMKETQRIVEEKIRLCNDVDRTRLYYEDEKVADTLADFNQPAHFSASY